jgi:heme-degrading monooxygenase HmoA
MITRIWHGRTAPRHAGIYLDFLLTDGTKEYRATPGNISVKVWKRAEMDCCHFYTVTEWVNLEAVKRFAGADYEKAVYYPEDQGILLEFEEKVYHYESYDVTEGPGDAGSPF